MRRLCTWTLGLLVATLFSLLGLAAAQATAELMDTEGNVVGSATFTLEGEAVRVQVEVMGFTAAAEGEHGIHIHETGACEPDFMAAGEHFNPTGMEHGLENPEGPHAGDLPTITIDAEGNATYEAMNDRIDLSTEAGRSILAGDGSTLVIHAQPDDQVTDPAGMSGERIACGVILAEGAQAPSPMGAEAQTAQSTTMAPEAVRPTPELMDRLSVPEGFEVGVFAQGLANPRMMVQGPDGSVYVTQRDAGELTLLRDANGDGQADEMTTVFRNLDYLHGITYFDNALYLATDTELYRADLAEGGVSEPQLLIDDLPDAGQHPNRTLAFGPDGLLYLTIGSTCNACIEPHPESATLLQVQPDGASRTIFAEGLRNTIGFGWHPETGELWGMDHGSDTRGDDIPPEELNRLIQGMNYGWPFCYGEQEPDDYFSMSPPGATKAEYCALTEPPVLTYQAHSAPIGMVFYTGEQFPEDYRGNAFVAMRGSWNRGEPVGYKVIRIPFENGEPGEPEDFLSGFLLEDGLRHFGRVAGLLVLQDGSLLVSEDTGGVIYRVSYNGAGQ